MSASLDTVTQHHHRRRRRPHYSATASSSGTIYPLHPGRRLARINDTQVTWLDQCLVAGSSLAIVGAVVWVPTCVVWAYRKWQSVREKRRKAAYAALCLAAVGVYAGLAPQRHYRVGQWLQVRKWKLWQAWIRFLAVEVILDQPKQQQQQQQSSSSAGSNKDLANLDAILAFVPHGIFPFAFGVGAITDYARQIFGAFRPMVASIVLQVPILGDLVGMLHGLDASRRSVHQALQQGHRVGVIPGGISEMFSGYPRPGCHPDEEFAIVRKGFLRMALRHDKPVVPIYCFGSTKLFRRWHLPALETLSNVLRASIIVFYGVWGLPIPFRQRLTYVVGDPICPDSAAIQALPTTEAQVNALHEQFCQELHRLFERHKQAYGWGHKTIQLLSK